MDLAIHAKVDDVMRTVMEQLNLRVDDGDIGIIAVVPNSAFPTTTETENRPKRKRRTSEISGEIIEDNVLKKEEATLTVEDLNIKMEDSEKKPKLEDTIE